MILVFLDIRQLARFVDEVSEGYVSKVVTVLDSSHRCCQTRHHQQNKRGCLGDREVHLR